jgi:(2R)-3-sulfolactate dehydrogenase (NADP+)
MSGAIVVAVEDLRGRCERSLRAAGASQEQASVLAEATVQAEAHGRPALGVAHLLDYLDGFRCGRISAAAPTVDPRTDVIVNVDCADGIAQHGFVEALPWLVGAARTHGMAVAAISRCFTAGEVGFYIRSLAAHGLTGMAFANSPALMAVAESRDPLLGTNPLAFGTPLPDGRMVGFDQAASATAWVSVREAADSGESLAQGVAVDRSGAPTTSAAEALEGAVLPFGGYKGGNIALLVELMAALAGGTFSCEAGRFDRGAVPPSIGLFVIAFAAEQFGPSYGQRVSDQLEHWQDEHGADTRRWTRTDASRGEVTIDEDLLARLS